MRGRLTPGWRYCWSESYSPRIPSRRLRMAREESGRELILEAMPQTNGTSAAAPKPIKAMPAFRRAD